MKQIARRWALVVFACSGVVTASLASPAGASAATPPQAALTRAQSQLQALIAGADPSAKADLTDAVSQLGQGTAAYLWPDASDALPPRTGDLVFTDAAAALDDVAKIHHDTAVPGSVLSNASDEIADACRDLAAAALRRAGLRGGTDGGSVHEDQMQYDRGFGALGAEITSAVTGVAQQTVEQAAERFLDSPDHFGVRPSPLSGPPLTLAGKPELFYYGAEFCPYCAVDRWPMVRALVQFGKFSPLALSESSPIDLFPSTNTFTFYGSDYDSAALSFAPVEGTSNQQCTPGTAGCAPYGFALLQTPDAAEQQILNQYDPQELFPFLDFANMWQDGPVVLPDSLQGLSWEQIAAAVGDPNSAVGQYLDGAAELFAAQICETTGEQPSRVCGTAVNRQYQQLLTSPGASIDGANSLYGVSCSSTALCATVDSAGNTLITQDPTASTPSWSAPDNIDGTTAITSVACPSASMCIAVDAAGNALVTHNANAPTPKWSAPATIDGANPFDFVRCPSTSLCVAVDSAGNALYTDDPSSATPTWSVPMNIDGINGLTVSCPSTRLCVAGDAAGNTLVTHNANAATPTWSTPQSTDSQAGIADISCPSTSFCVAVDFSGDVIVTNDPSAATPTWSAPRNIDDSHQIFGVSCASTSLCVAVDSFGDVVISDDPAAAKPTWTVTDIDPPGLYDVSCPTTSLCVAVDSDGVAIESNDPAAATPIWDPPTKFLH